MPGSLYLLAIIALGVILIKLAYRESKKKNYIHGSAVWATKRKIAKAGLFSSGILLGKAFGKFVYLPGDTFALVAAPTRSGKGVSIVIPNLLSWAGSAVVLDIKLENYKKTSGFRKKYGQKVYVFNPAPKDYRTHRYNPLGYISNDKNHRVDDVQKIASYLIPTPRGTDPMWSSEGRDLLSGLILMVMEVEGIPITLGEVLRQLKTEVDSAVHIKSMINENELSEACKASLYNFCSKASKERSGVKSTVTGALAMWANPLVDAAMSENDFDIRELREKKMTIYIGVTPDNLSRMAPIVNLLFQQLIDLNTQKIPNEIPYQVLLVLDEFPAIGRIETLEKTITFIAGYGLRLLTIMQSPTQLYSVYGQDVAETMIRNHAASIVFRPEKMKEATEISNEIGNKTAEQVSYSLPAQIGKMGNRTLSGVKRPLILPQEIKEIPNNIALIFTSGLPPIWATKITYYKDKAFRQRILEPIAIPAIEIRESVAISNKNDEINPVPQRNLTEAELDEQANIFFKQIQGDS